MGGSVMTVVGTAVGEGVVAGPQADRSRTTKSKAPSKVLDFILLFLSSVKM
jgi:hypothetical protein